MGNNPLVGVVFGAIAIGFAVYSLATQTETPPDGYNWLNYGLIIAGAAGIIGSLVAYAMKGNRSAPPPSS
jgi:predicted acyltransferase